jgi:mono/diheme cytochrome c family protein
MRGLQLAFLLAAVLMVGVGFVFLTPGADAKQKFMSGFAQAYPAAAGTPLDSCLLCHTDPVDPDEDNLNDYGEDWEDGDFGDKDYLASALVNRDSDGDGVKNGQEIQQLSLPGDPASSTPPTTTTTVAGTPPDGQALYSARCAVCHGPNGGDLSGTSLGRSTFINITVNGQGGMPPQANLSNEEAGAIWDYVTGTVPPTTTTTQPGATTTTTQPAGGATVWAQQCAVCHGADGGNVVPTSMNKTQLVSLITNGVGTMRGFPELGTTQISNVANYLLNLSVPPTTLPGATTTTTSPRSGATVYAASCSLCHGASGGNLRGHTLSLTQIISITTNGVGTMSGYSSKLSSAEINNVSQYVASVGTSAGVTTTTVPAGTPISGSNLYMQNCSACHGLHGEGGPGGGVAGTSMNRGQIISITTTGAGGMPGYKPQLSTSEIAAIADHILGMASSGRTTTGEDGGDGAPVGEPVIPPELAEGHSLYGQFCAACHGTDGEGGLGGPVANINMSAAELDEIIRNGVGSMPGFADRMSDAEIDALVAFSEALAAGVTFEIQETTTTTSSGEETLAAGNHPTAVAGDLVEGDSEGGSSPITIVAIALGVLIAGGAAFLWMRAARNLVS